MSVVPVGVGDCRVSKEPETILITYALGTCVAVLIHDPVSKVGGLLHFMLPESAMDPGKAMKQPFMFADTGIPLLFRQAYKLGADKKRLSVTVAGGSRMMDPESTFNIGERNYLAMREILWKAGVFVKTEELGGAISRTIRMEIGSGKIFLRRAGEQERELPVRIEGHRI